MANSPLTIGFDVTPILYNRGVSRYTANIVRALAKEDDVTLRLFGSSFRQHKSLKNQVKALSKEIGGKTKPSVLSFPPTFLWRMWYGVGRLHIESLMPKVDVFHAWEELIPPSYKTPIVATIHDLAPFKFPQMVHSSTREKHMQAYKRLKTYNAHVIAVSEQTKRDCIELLQFDPDHVHVVYEALPSEAIVNKSDILPAELLIKYGVTKPYFLWVGTQEPRKNLARVVEAWKTMQKDFDLVLVGAAGANAVEPQQGIKIVGYLNNVDLASLYSHATALVFPSLYEGFGLPILEAYHYGCPVVTSNNSGMLEAADDAAVLVDPFSSEAIAEGMKKVVRYKDSSDKRDAMKKQLKKFSWEKSARQTLAVYQAAKADGR